MHRLNHYYLFKVLRFTAVFFLACWAWGCEDHDESGPGTDSGKVLNISGRIEQECLTRVDDGGFADGDCMGVFVVDYEDSKPGVLQGYGNRATNFALTYEAASGVWKGNSSIYWKDQYTPVDVYGYYPFENGLTEVNAYPFAVAADQSVKREGEMGAYEQSDFLWAKSEGVQPTTDVISLTYHHRMAGVKVILTQGEGFTGDEWTKLPRLVTVDNVLRNATIDLATGTVSPTGSYDTPVTMSPESGDSYRAVTVPQTVAAGKSVIGITIDKKSYHLTKGADMVYLSGKLHTFTIEVNKTAESGDYELSLKDETIAEWENDESSHNFELAAYVNVDVKTAGTLEACLKERGTNVENLKNLKITGQLTDQDFQYIREKMIQLTALNLREVKMVHVETDPINEPGICQDDMLPNYALNNKSSLRTLILPESIVRIGVSALSGTQLTHQLVIPNRVKRLDENAISYIKEMNLEVILPDSLEYIGNRALSHTEYTCEFKLPNTVRYIGYSAFEEARQVYGTFRLPDNLEYLGEGAFMNMGHDMTGDIVIPQQFKTVPANAFNNIGFAKGTKLTLHDGVSIIGKGAFYKLKFSSPVSFPASLTTIHQDAFAECLMLGTLNLPSRLSFIGKRAFGTYVETTEVTGLNGELELPSTISVISNDAFYGQSFTSVTLSDQITHINERAFMNDKFIKTVTTGKNLDYIGPDAFSGCGALQTFICLNPEPPELSSGAFGGIYWDKVVLEVPEQSVERYRNASGWNQFQNITAHKELAFNIPSITCLQGGITREGVVRSEGEWEITEHPDWCTVTPMQGGTDRREEVTVKVNPMNQGSGTRSGRIVFQLKGTEYTTYAEVTQYDYEYNEDQEIVLQDATAGAAPVSLFIIGDGFDAGEIADGTYLKLMKEQMEHFFNVEPYRTYRSYFKVSTAVAVSPEKGISTAGEPGTQSNRFNTYMDIYGLHTDNTAVRDYAKKLMGSAPSTLLLLCNYQGFLSTTDRSGEGNLSVCTLSNDTYPYDQRGLIQHEVGGHNFGGLGDESVGHFEFIQACTCPSCNALCEFTDAKSRGEFENLSLSGSINSVPWKHLIFDPRFSKYVDVYEGGYNHLRGVYRSEPQSCMGTYIPYYNAISRETIVRRIMSLSGRTFNFEDFVTKDKWDGRPEE